LTKIDVRFGELLFPEEFIWINSAVVDVVAPIRHLPEGQAVAYLMDYACREVRYPETRQGLSPDRHELYAFPIRDVPLFGVQYRYHKVTDEFFQYPHESLAWHYGDCLSEDTKVLVVNLQGRYESRCIADLAEFEGYQAVSYDMFHQGFCIRPITNFIYKGYRPVFKVTLRNGTSFKSTSGHRFFTPNRKVFQLSDIKRNQPLLCARKIPAIDFNSHVTDEELWLYGFYLAEGYPKQKGCNTLCLANDSPRLQRKAMAFLETLGMPYTPPSRKKHAYITIKKPVGDTKAGYVKKNLLALGDSSLTKQMPEWFLSLNRRQLAILLDGFVSGDSHYPRPSHIGRPRSFTTRRDPRGPKPRLEHSTSSAKLATQIRLAHLILGRPVYTQFVEHHGGAGHNPIWRLYENENSWFNKPTLHNLSKVSIRSVEPCGDEPVYDITVEGTHNFLLSDSSILAHNCDDTSILVCALLRAYGISPDRVSVVVGEVDGYGHAWVELDGQIIETTLCSPPTPAHVSAQALVSQLIGWQKPAQYSEEWRFNDRRQIGEVTLVPRVNERAKLALIARIWNHPTKGLFPRK
jgi:hypothetical protein